MSENQSPGTAFLLDFVGEPEPPRDDLPLESFLELLGEAIPRFAYQGTDPARPASRVPGVALMLKDPAPGLAFVPFVNTQEPLPLSTRDGVLLGVPAPGVLTYCLSEPWIS